MDPLERARTKQRDVAERTQISIPLALLEDMIQEVTELRQLLEEGASAIKSLDDGGVFSEEADKHAKATALHGRPRLRPVGGDEGRSSPDRGGKHGSDDAA